VKEIENFIVGSVSFRRNRRPSAQNKFEARKSEANSGAGIKKDGYS
jgi:hypothetical protein